MAHRGGQALMALPEESSTAALHCVTTWSKFGTNGRYGGGDLAPEHGGPARLLVLHLCRWKSAIWVRNIDLRQSDVPGVWEGAGYHNYPDARREQGYQGD